MATAALHYFDEAYTTKGAKLMGRHAAGESFLRGMFQYATSDDFWVYVDKRSYAQLLPARMQAEACAKKLQIVDPLDLHRLANPGAIFTPGPGLNTQAWYRTYFAPNAWSICGITHTISTMGAMDGIVDILMAPTQPWDALICTSTEAKKSVQRLWTAQAEYLKDRFKIQQLVLPQLPVIPLGIHTQDFAFSDSDKAEARAAIGADDKTIVVLFTGRLSFHAKAHPLAMYQALENASQHLPAGHKLMLVEFGMHSNDYIRDAFKEASAMACPCVQVLHLHGGAPENFKLAWASADIFCSLSDNFQETFGIVPVEAMAAGLPVVVSDWDGYKDTVRDGVDGFRISTRMPQEGAANSISYRYTLEIDNYDHYCGYTSALVSVNITAATEAFVRLIQQPELRKQMGQAGRERAVSTFDWRHIIPQYEALWAELETLRKAYHRESPPLKTPWPARMSPLSAFASYASDILSLESRLKANSPNLIAQYRQLKTIKMVSYTQNIIANDKLMESLLALAQYNTLKVKDFIDANPPADGQRIFISLAMLCKLGFLEIVQSEIKL